MIRITQQRSKCIGCNYCVEVAPQRWKMNPTDGKSTLIGGKEKRGFFTLVVTPDEYQSNAEAARLCPVNSIRVQKI